MSSISSLQLCIHGSSSDETQTTILWIALKQLQVVDPQQSSCGKLFDVQILVQNTLPNKKLCVLTSLVISYFFWDDSNENFLLAVFSVAYNMCKFFQLKGLRENGEY